MNRRYKRFLRQTLPTIKLLASNWFPADKTNNQGQYYACTYCDQNCSQHDRHDDDCLYEMAKITTEELTKLENTIQNKTDWKGRPYSKEDLEQILLREKVEAVLKIMYLNPSKFIPLDYSDPANEGVVCTCFIFQQNGEEREHNEYCVYQAFARAYSNLFKIGEPR
jgi:hypothetical protein